MQDTRHRLIGATLATAMLRTNRRASAQEWSGVVSGVDDPFIRAVLRRISGEGWDSVLSSAGEDGMGVADRLSIAVCNLGDREVSLFIAVLTCPRRSDKAKRIAIGVPPLLGIFPDRTAPLPLTPIWPHTALASISGRICLADRRCTECIAHLGAD